jgi:hypothetical protein
MMKPRISLRSLFVVATLLIVCLGYSQIRRKRILEMCAELRKDGYYFETPNDFRDFVWQRKPLIGTVYEDAGESFFATRLPTRFPTRETDASEIARLKVIGVVIEGPAKTDIKVWELGLAE